MPKYTKQNEKKGTEKLLKKQQGKWQTKQDQTKQDEADKKKKKKNKMGMNSRLDG